MTAKDVTSSKFGLAVAATIGVAALWMSATAVTAQVSSSIDWMVGAPIPSAEPLYFEVASIKPMGEWEMSGFAGVKLDLPGGRLTAIYQSLSDLIQFAYCSTQTS